MIQWLGPADIFSHPFMCSLVIPTICRTMGVKTVNVVRDRADMAGVRATLEGMGADIVLTEEEIRATQVYASELCLLQGDS